MGLHSVQDWIAWSGIVIALFATAWAAVMFVWVKQREIKIQEYQMLHEVMTVVGEGTSIAPRIAAAYELRNFRAYRDVVIRFCEVAKIGGPAGDELMAELSRIKIYLEGNENRA